MSKNLTMCNNSTLDAMVTALSVLSKIYSSSSVDDYGNVVIGVNSYPDFLKKIVVEMEKLKRIIASSLLTGRGPANEQNSPAVAGPVERRVRRELTAEQILKAIYAYGYTADDIVNIGMDVIVDITTAVEQAHGISGA